MYTGKPPIEQRVGAGIGTAVVCSAIGWALLVSLAYVKHSRGVDALPAVTVVPLPPPPPHVVVPERKPSKAPEGEAAPPNVRSTPTEVVAPKTIVLLPPPIPVATVAGSGSQTSAGAAELPGPGQGAGGIGNGRGSGGSGNGTGSGFDDETPPRWIRGRLDFSDAARVVGWENLVGRSMTTRSVVGVDGRVSGCQVSRSSGLPELDAAICALIVQRFRYRPSLDGAGRPIRAGVEMDHSWDQRY